MCVLNLMMMARRKLMENLFGIYEKKNKTEKHEINDLFVTFIDEMIRTKKN